jgi:hypothetical protein
LQKAQRDAAGWKPTVTKPALLALLRESASEAARVVKAVEAGGRMVKGEEAGGLKECVPALVRAEMRDVDARLLAKHGLDAGEVEAALRYYTRGPGRDAAVVDAAKAVRRVLAKTVLTKRRILETVVGMHDAQIEALDGVVEEVLDQADPGDPRFSAVLQGAFKRVAAAWVAEETGLAGGVDELMAVAQGEAMRDPEYGAALQSALTECTGKVNAALQGVLAGKGMRG